MDIINQDVIQSNPRFVVLFHEIPPESGRANHWDLMLEYNGALETWAVDAEPRPGKTVSAIKLPQHRLDYLVFEGEISDGRGRVTRVMEGRYAGTIDEPGLQNVFEISLFSNQLTREKTMDVRFLKMEDGKWQLEFVE